MPQKVALVTDSTAQLPQPLREAHAVTVVPLTVVLGDEALEDGTPAAAERLVPALRGKLPVTTSRPSPETFAEAYRAAASAGAEAVVSVHLSAEISGTYDAAVLGARHAPIPVRVVDSRMIAMALGFAVLAAAETVAAGGSAEEAAAAAEKRSAGTCALFSVDTLDHLRRGGRISATQALLGSALAVKPLLELNDGRIILREKVRTTGRAVARLEELALEHAGTAPAQVAVQHLAADERAEQLAERLRERLPAASTVGVHEVGAVLGAHTGPGLLGAVVAPG